MNNTTNAQPNLFPEVPTARNRPYMFRIIHEWHIAGGGSLGYVPLPILKLTAGRGVKSWAETDLPSLKSHTAVAEHDGWLWVAGGYKSRYKSRVTTVDCVDARNGEVVEMPS